MSITKPNKAEIALTLFASRLARRIRYRDFVEGIGLEGNERVLDFGAGWGDNTRYIAMKLDKGGKVTALDVSREWQDVAKKRLKTFRNIDYVNADIRSADLPDASFDVIVISYVLHDIPSEERAAIIKELAKKLKPNGFIQLREPTRKRHGMPVEEIRSLMKSARMKESTSINKGSKFNARYAKTGPV